MRTALTADSPQAQSGEFFQLAQGQDKIFASILSIASILSNAIRARRNMVKISYSRLDYRIHIQMYFCKVKAMTLTAVKNNVIIKMPSL